MTGSRSRVHVVSHASHLMITLTRNASDKKKNVVGDEEGLLFPDLLIIPLLPRAFLVCVWPVSSIVCVCVYVRQVSKNDAELYIYRLQT